VCSPRDTGSPAERMFCSATYVRVFKGGTRPMALGGDSGGPVFDKPGRNAVGIVIGERYGKDGPEMLYMPIEYISDLGLEVLTSEPPRPSPDDVATFYDFGAGARIHTWLSRGSSFAYQGPRGWWRVSRGYALEQVGGRMVAGDFDGDGDDDVAAFYDYGRAAARIHVWLSSGRSFSYRLSTGWWQAHRGTYRLSKAADRMTVGDYNGDGKDDIAAFYDYGGGEARIHVWLSTGSSFGYRWSIGWWGTSRGYWLWNKVGDRMVSGDFNRDGRDDIAVFYDYGAGAARIHVWLSTGRSFTYKSSGGWWSVKRGYWLNRVGGRMVAGDFDGDGDDDIATFYDYGSAAARVHVWLSSGSSFSYQGNTGWWAAPRGWYRMSALADRMTVGDFNGDGRDDIATFYDYRRGIARIHVFLSTGGSFTYQGNGGWWGSSGYWLEKVGDRMAAGGFK